MKKLRLSFDALLNRITIDGSADRIKVDEMSKVIIEIDDSVKTSVWVTLDAIDRDISFFGGNEDYYRLPVLSTLIGNEAPSEAGVEPLDGGILAMDLSSAPISSLLDQTFQTVSSGNGYVGVSVDGVKVNPSTYKMFLSTNERCTVLKFYESAPGSQHKARVKWRLCPWATTNGASAGGSIVIEPGYAERFSTAYVALDDWTVAPITISATEKRGHDLVPAVEGRLPSWVPEDYPRVVTFLEDFFEHFSQTGGGYDLLTRLHELDDIDLASQEFIIRMMKERLQDFPELLATDPRLLLKIAGHFYEGRGIADSVAFASRAVHGSPSWLGYPAERLIRGSASKWVQEESLRVTSLGDALMQRPEMKPKIIGPYRSSDPESYADAIELRDLEGYVISGMTSGATALVEQVDFQVLEGTLVADLKISTREGEFATNEVIVAIGVKDESNPIRLASAVGSQMIGITVTSGVPVVGDFVSFPAATKAGVNESGSPVTYQVTEPSAFISSINPLKIEVVEPGWLIDGVNTGTLMRRDITGTLAAVGTVTIVKSATRSLPGYWLDNSSFASDRYIVTNDSGRFQTFSYDLVSEDSEVFQSKHVPRLIHASGFNRHEVLEVTPAVAAAGYSTSMIAFDLLPQQNTVSIGAHEEGANFCLYLAERKLMSRDFEEDTNNSAEIFEPSRVSAVASVIKRSSQPAADYSLVLDNYSFSALSVSPNILTSATSSGFDTAVESYIKSLAMAECYPFKLLRATGTDFEDARRVGRVGAVLKQSAISGTVFASITKGSYTYFAVAFSSAGDATAFAFNSPFQSTNG